MRICSVFQVDVTTKHEWQLIVRLQQFILHPRRYVFESAFDHVGGRARHVLDEGVGRHRGEGADLHEDAMQVARSLAARICKSSPAWVQARTALARHPLCEILSIYRVFF